MTIDLIRQSLQAPNEELKYDGGWGDKYPANGFWRQEENQQQLKEALATIEVINSVDFCVICIEYFIQFYQYVFLSSFFEKRCVFFYERRFVFFVFS